jgi:hypothetical protein
VTLDRPNKADDRRSGVGINLRKVSKYISHTVLLLLDFSKLHGLSGLNSS